jgi:uncharacterized protein (TIGR00297 family)
MSGVVFRDRRARPRDGARASQFSETRRQTVHIAMGAFALLLRFLTWWQAALLAAVALAFNVLLLPRLGGQSLYRPADRARGFPTGILLYPLSVLLLILTFPNRLDIVAIAWSILAVGDGSATLIGRRVGGPRIPWNREKTIAGSLALFALGSAAGLFMAWWMRPAVSEVPAWFLVLAPVVAAAVAAAVETIPVRLDDNIGVPAAAALTLWMLTLVSPDALLAAWPTVRPTILPALLVNLIFAVIGWKGRLVSGAGAIAGAIIGFAIYAGAGLTGWIVLFAAFAVASISTRLGMTRKAVLGIAEEREGRRGPGNALANCGVAACAALVAVASPYREEALLVFVTALAAGGSDTVASEIGKAWGRRTFLVTGFRRVQPGTPGAISLEGTAAGLVAALGLAAFGIAGNLIPGALVWAVVAGATIGSFVESVLGATLEPRGILNNDLLNFINTAVAAGAAVALGQPFG